MCSGAARACLRVHFQDVVFDVFQHDSLLVATDYHIVLSSVDRLVTGLEFRVLDVVAHLPAEVELSDRRHARVLIEP